MTISIAEDFSKCPGGRFPCDGPYSAEEFRDNILIPALRNNNKVIIKLDGTRGYSSCFLEEVFGGLYRNGVSIKDINKIKLESSRKSLINEIKIHMKKAGE